MTRIYRGKNMLSIKPISRILYSTLLAAVALAVIGVAQAVGGNLNLTDKWAWSTNAGWINFNPAGYGGVTVFADHLEGYAWAENFGWIRLGTHTGGGAHTYGNISKDDYGVNRSGGQLSGNAWSSNVGWINFKPTGYDGVSIDTITGRFNGYAWSENVGWIHFKNYLWPVYLPIVLR